MPIILDYDDAMQTLTAQGLICNYHNSGAFGFPRGVQVQYLAWVGPDDPTIRPAAHPFVRRVAAPYPQTLADKATSLWQAALPGAVWVQPMSHWAYELDFGSRSWLPGLLEQIHLAPADLQARNNGSPIQFQPEESEPFKTFLNGLLQHLSGSDFMLAFPGRRALCTVHHHQQLWWVTPDLSLLTKLEEAVADVNR